MKVDTKKLRLWVLLIHIQEAVSGYAEGRHISRLNKDIIPGVAPDATAAQNVVRSLRRSGYISAGDRWVTITEKGARFLEEHDEWRKFLPQLRAIADALTSRGLDFAYWHCLKYCSYYLFPPNDEALELLMAK